MNRFRNKNSAGRSSRLQSRGNIHGIPKNIPIFKNHFPLVNTDPQFKRLQKMAHFLNLYSGINSVTDRRKTGKNAVTKFFDPLTTKFFNDRLLYFSVFAE